MEEQHGLPEGGGALGQHVVLGVRVGTTAIHLRLADEVEFATGCRPLHGCTGQWWEQ